MDFSSANPQKKAHAKLDDLPESCISAILSFTTPRDAFRLAAICKLFRSAVCSDSVWNKWLPPNYQQILSTTLFPIHFSCKKELFFHLSRPIRIDGGTKLFWLERSTAKICYMLSARELCYGDYEGECYPPWLRDASIPSRSFEVAQLRMDPCLKVSGKFDCRLLSANTEYSISFLIKFLSLLITSYLVPVMFGVKTAEGDWKECERVLLKDIKYSCLDLNMRIAPLIERDDGWVEIIAGKFSTKENWGLEGAAPFVEFWMEEGNSMRWEKGFLLGGVIIKPISI